MKNTYAFYRYRRFHESLNREMRFLYGAIKQVSTSRPADQRVAGDLSCIADAEVGYTCLILPTGDEPWGDSKWRDTQRVFLSAETHIAEMGIVKVMSAFEVFIGGVFASYRDCLVSEAPPELIEDEKVGLGPLQRLISYMASGDRRLSVLADVFPFFWLLRNCIVHGGSVAGNALQDYGGSEAFVKGIRAWSKTFGAEPIDIPDATAGKSLKISPRHAIFTSDVCFRIAEMVNAGIVSKNREDLFVGEAYRVVFGATRFYDEFKSYDAAGLWRHCLSVIFGVELTSKKEGIELLKRHERWLAAQSAFRALYGNRKSRKQRRIDNRIARKEIGGRR